MHGQRCAITGCRARLERLWPATIPRRIAAGPRRRWRVAAGEGGGKAGGEPTVDLVFVTREAGTVEVTAQSGEQLRAIMMDNKVDLYTAWGKVWSCGGVGQCGTCIVKVDEGADLMSERTETEQRKLKGKPESWRLACQTLVGDGEQSGRVVISTKPQT